MMRESSAKIIKLERVEKSEEEAKLEAQIKEMITTLKIVYRAGKLVGENNLAARLIIDIHSLLSHCFKVSEINDR